MINKQLSIEMVHLVKKGPGEKAGCLPGYLLAVDIPTGQGNLLGARHRAVDAGKAEAPFFT